ADVARGADAVIFMLPNEAALRQVLFEQGLAEGLPAGGIAIDMGTTSPAATREIGNGLAALDLHYLDAPVMGGVVFARDASLDIMVGGNAAAIERCRPLFEAMGRKLWNCGASGNAQVLKAMTNYINACALANTLEAMVIARKSGLDSSMVAEAIDTMCNGRQHPIVKKIIPHVLTREYGTGMTLQLIAKDVQIAVDSAHGVNAPVPLGEVTARIWNDACDLLGGARDQTEIVRYWEQAAGIPL
ncbi:MAG TPA: NAD(P)-dependent oxidoreductase, partial [Burkholderiaceae bacterium]|nr:NAD(P)-dependent oxidoreductase [Burkholderiaceae bacterium]